MELKGHLLLPNFLKRTKLASYLCWSLPNYPFSHFENTKFRKLYRFVGGLQWPGSWGGPVVLSQGWKFFRIKFLSRVDRPPSLVLVGLFWWSMMPGRLICLWFWSPFQPSPPLHGHKIGRLQLNPAESTTGGLATNPIRVKNGGFYAQEPLSRVLYLHFCLPLVLQLTERGESTFSIDIFFVPSIISLQEAWLVIQLHMTPWCALWY